MTLPFTILTPTEGTRKHAPTMARRQHLTATVLLAVVLFFTITYLLSGTSSPGVDRTPAESKSEFKVDLDDMPASLLEGDSIAPKLENATLKYVSPQRPTALSI